MGAIYASRQLAKSHPMDASGSKNIYWVDNVVNNQLHGLLLYRVIFLTGPAQKSSKYGTGPTQ